MENIVSCIEKYGLIKNGETVAVACSGGKDSMALLHYLWTNKDRIGCNVVAVNVDHSIRKVSAEDSAFVDNYCKKNGIKLYSYKVDAVKYSQDNKISIEQSARECRYKIFKSLVSKGSANKIVLAHHMQDQAETILLNLFRGTGIAGAGGMDYIRDEIYIRPMLNTTQTAIMAYIGSCDIPYVEDETNQETEYSRNYIRNTIMPLIRNKWPSADKAISNFGKNCKQDESYIQSTISESAILPEEGLVRINFNYFVYPDAYVFRLILKALKKIGITHNIENKHLKMIKNMALEAENGTKINLAEGLTVIKEYNYITFTNRKIKIKNKHYPFTRGKLDISGYGVIDTVLTKRLNINEYSHLIDIAKLPKDVEWRFRKDGDTFEKFGGGSKSLSDYLIDKKVPVRIRNIIPVLAKGSEVYIIAGVEISNKLKVDKNTKTAYGINVKRF